MPELDSRLSIVLVNPENPENIGAVARAMKNMGFSDLRLVNPPFMWQKNGVKMAMSARDVFEGAQVFAHVAEALRDIHFTVGTTRRYGVRRGRGVFLPFDEAMLKIAKTSQDYRAGILFGRESKGLSNRDLAACDWVTTIPVHAVYPSINLAQAVMLVVFSLFRLDHDGRLKPLPPAPVDAPRYVSKEEVNALLPRFQIVLERLGYGRHRGGLVGRILNTFHGLLKRGGVLQGEAQMLKGFFRRIIEKVPKN